MRHTCQNCFGGLFSYSRLRLQRISRFIETQNKIMHTINRVEWNKLKSGEFIGVVNIGAAFQHYERRLPAWNLITESLCRPVLPGSFQLNLQKAKFHVEKAFRSRRFSIICRWAFHARTFHYGVRHRRQGTLSKKFSILASPYMILIRFILHIRVCCYFYERAEGKNVGSVVSNTHETIFQRIQCQLPIVSRHTNTTQFSPRQGQILVKFSRISSVGITMSFLQFCHLRAKAEENLKRKWRHNKV